MILWDLHTHSNLSDGRDTPAQMAEAACEKGLAVFGLCDHSYLPWGTEWCLPAGAEENYRATVAALKAQYAGRMRVLCGIEQDIGSLTPTDAYDYVIGSVHNVEKDGEHLNVDNTAAMMCENVARYFGGDYYAYAEAFFAAEAEWARRPDIDIVGHFDLLTKFNEGERYFDETDPRYLRPAEEALAALCARGLIFEINTGAISRGYRTAPYPALHLLKRIRAHGGRITFSGDAHTMEHIAFRFDTLRDLAVAAGFAAVAAPGKTGFVELAL